MIILINAEKALVFNIIQHSCMMLSLSKLGTSTKKNHTVNIILDG